MMMTTHSLYQATITDENTLYCPHHSSPLTNLYYEPSSTRLVCSECINTPNFDKSHLIKTRFQAYDNPRAYVISLLNLPKRRGDNEKAPVDFQNCQLEHIIVVQNPNNSKEIQTSYGYYPRSLVYIPEKKLLAADSLDGYLYFWSMGATVEFVQKINIGRQIRFLKYFDIDKKGKCLIIGTDFLVHFYDLQGQEPKYIESMTCEASTNDIAYIPHQKKLITVGNGSLVRFWSLENSSWKGEKVPKSYGIKGPILSVEYIERSHCLALETDSGLNLLDLNKGELKDTREPFMDNKRGFSLGHLPKAGQMLLFRRESGLNVLNEKDFKLLYEYPEFRPIAFAPGLKFIPNEDESQFLSNGNGSCVYICDDKTSNRLDMTGLATKTSAVEVLHDQHRFVIGDQHRGTLFVFKTNVKGDQQHQVEKGTLERVTIEHEISSSEESSPDQEEEVVVVIEEEEQGVPAMKAKVSRVKKTSPRKIQISPPALKAKAQDKAIQKPEKKPSLAAGLRRTRAAAKSEIRVTRSANKKESPRKPENRRSNKKDLAKKPTSHAGKITLKPVKMKFVLPFVSTGNQGLPVNEEEEGIRKSKTASPNKKLKEINMKLILPRRGKGNDEQSRERSRSKSKSPSTLKRMNTMEKTAKEGRELVKKRGYGRGKRSQDKKINYKE